MIRGRILLGAVLIGVTAVGLSTVPAGAAGVASIGESGDMVELRHQIQGQVVVDRLPLYRSGAVRYFSAGVGLEERQAEYPPFSLKLVFTAGGKPFLAGVAVTIKPAAGGVGVTIPAEHVQGPWLFVDLPVGLYGVTATHAGNTQRLMAVKVEAGRQTTLHLRWPEDRGIAALPAE